VLLTDCNLLVVMRRQKTHEAGRCECADRNLRLEERVMDENMIPVIVVPVVFGLPVAALIVWMTLNYKKRLRLMDLNHKERMTAIERGMELPPLNLELIDGRSVNPKPRRTSLLPGLVWFFVGLSVLISTRSFDEHASFLGLIPVAIGLAYLIYYFAEGRKIEAAFIDRDLGERGNKATLEPPRL
jgi:hypothetical protein